MNCNIKFISISGPDGVGKTSTISLLHKITDYAYVIYDRDIPDQICYAKLAKRKLNSDLIEYMNANNQQLYVILNSDEKTIKKRMQQRNDTEVPEGTTLEQAIEFFNSYKDNKNNNVLYIDNTNLSVEDVVKLILQKVK